MRQKNFEWLFQNFLLVKIAAHYEFRAKSYLKNLLIVEQASKRGEEIEVISTSSPSSMIPKKYILSSPNDKDKKRHFNFLEIYEWLLTTMYPHKKQSKDFILYASSPSMIPRYPKAVSFILPVILGD